MIKSAIFILFSLISYVVAPGGQDEKSREVNQFIDDWHAAAARADSDAYFGAFADDGVFIGTDKSEVWTRQEFYEWSKPYFEKGKAWEFHGKERNIYFSDDGSIAWFDELAHSASGDWRGSGVLALTDQGWKIKQYVLSITVPNEIMSEVVKLVKEYEGE